MTQDKDGHKYWKCKGILHNPDGPAIIRNNGKTRFFLNGIEAKSKKEFKSKAFKNKAAQTELC